MDTPFLTLAPTTSRPSSPLCPQSSATSTADLTTSTDTILLNVSGTPFTTTIGTLTSRSDFFAALLSGRWPIPLSPSNPSETNPLPNSLFVDADPTLFAHLLRYLRRGVFPLSYSPAPLPSYNLPSKDPNPNPNSNPPSNTGHDLLLYTALLPESLYFQTPLLTLWLSHALYHRCISHTSSYKRLSDSGLGTETWTSVEGTQLVKRRVSEDHKWVCPGSLREDSHRLVYGHGLCGEPSEGVVNRCERTEWMEYGTKREVRGGWCWDEG